MKIHDDKFRNYIKSLRKSRGLNKGEIAEMLEMSLQNFSNQLNKKPIEAKFISLVCAALKTDTSPFIEISNDNNESETASFSTVSETMPIYELDTIKSRVKEIESQFDTIIKGNETIKNMLLSGVQFMDVQKGNMSILKKLVGI